MTDETMLLMQKILAAVGLPTRFQCLHPEKIIIRSCTSMECHAWHPIWDPSVTSSRFCTAEWCFQNSDDDVETVVETTEGGF
jgi:hypothetical protein